MPACGVLEEMAGMTEHNTIGSVAVVGGGVAGIQAALDLAESGFLVYLIEKTGTIGGAMTQLDKTFPSNDCSMCTIAPKLVECGRHVNIKVMTLCELTELTGTAGNFTLAVKESPRYVDMAKCIAAVCVAKNARKASPANTMRWSGCARPSTLNTPRLFR